MADVPIIGETPEAGVQPDPDAGRVRWPVPIIPLPGVFDVQSGMSSDGGTPLVIIALYQPSGATFFQADREQALELASAIRHAAQTGPQLDDPEVTA